MQTAEQAIKDAFLATVERPASERTDLLDDFCGTDAEKRRRVEALLDAHDAPGDFAAAYRPSADPRHITPAIGSRIGSYTLLQQLGEGGMGVVYLAEQSQPVQRRVAIKIIKAGMDSRQVIARFEAERQALAMMDHANIARVVDAGTTPGARPYFVMELVQGVPITKYCDDHHLTPRQRLELFVPVCQAIQHAHQKGIIHRDIKPSNVLVALYDGRPVPKVIDFGVAKATGHQLTERTLNTQFGALIGTLEYMSPEQAGMSALGVDTRSDIYSLGVLLYELLTGTTPLSHQRLRAAAYGEIIRMIQEEEAPLPSARLTASGEALATISAQRHTEPAKLAKLVRGELDWIVMKTLEKDPNRRYETANAFAADVQRYLADEPVQACPPSAGYRLRKFVRRNKAVLVTVSVVAVALIFGTVISAWQAVRARQAERDAVTQRDAAKASEADMEAFGKFLVEDVLAVARPKGQMGGLGITVTVKQGIDAAAPKIAETFAGRPRAEAKARAALGMTYVFLSDAAAAIGQLELAVELFRQQLGPEHVETLNTVVGLAIAYNLAERRDKSLPLLEEALKLQKSILGPNHVTTLGTLSTLAWTYRDAGRINEALPLLEEVFKLQKVKLGIDHESTLSTMNSLGGAYQFAGRFDEALKHYEGAVALQKAKAGPNHPHTLAFMGNLAGAYRLAGRLDDAIAVFEESLKLMKAHLGPDHQYVLGTMGNLGVGYLDTGRLTEALSLLEETLKLQTDKLGPNHSYTLSTMSNLAATYRQLGRFDEAATLFESILKLQKSILEPDHPSTLATMSNLGEAMRIAGRSNEALLLLEEALALQKAKHGPDHPKMLTTMSRLAEAHRARGNAKQARELHAEAVKLRTSTLGAEHPETLGSMADLGLVLIEAKQYAEAEVLLRACEATRERLHPNHWTTFNAKSLLGGSLLGQKDYAAAEPLLAAGYDGMKLRETKIALESGIYLTDALDRLVQLYEATARNDQAAVWREELARRREAERRAEPKQK